MARTEAKVVTKKGGTNKHTSSIIIYENHDMAIAMSSSSPADTDTDWGNLNADDDAKRVRLTYLLTDRHSLL